MNADEMKAAAAKSPPDCPDFELAPLVPFPPEVFAREFHAADAFVLALALAFNDMKGVQWLIVQLDKCKPEPKVDPASGQWQGMRLQTTRLTLLVLHEVLKAIETADHDHILEDADFTEALKRINIRYRDDWNELLALAKDAPSSSPMRKYITRVRHTFAAHYYQPSALWAGYQEFFFEQPRNAFNAAALASFGTRVEATRFYFADAAAQMGQALLDPSDDLVKQMRNYVLRMFQGLRFLIEAYLVLKRDRLAEKEA